MLIARNLREERVRTLNFEAMICENQVNVYDWTQNRLRIITVFKIKNFKNCQVNLLLILKMLIHIHVLYYACLCTGIKLFRLIFYLKNLRLPIVYMYDPLANQILALRSLARVASHYPTELSNMLQKEM